MEDAADVVVEEAVVVVEADVAAETDVGAGHFVDDVRSGYARVDWLPMLAVPPPLHYMCAFSVSSVASW